MIRGLTNTETTATTITTPTTTTQFVFSMLFFLVLFSKKQINS